MDQHFATLFHNKFYQVRKEQGPRNSQLKSCLYIDTAQGAPRRDEQNPLGGDPPRDYTLS